MLLLAAYGLIYPWLAFTANINWDEFNFLAGVYGLQDNRLDPGLNNFHGVIYAWLTAVPGIETTQIIAGRIGQLMLFAGAMGLLFAIARQFFSALTALIIVFLCVSYTDLLRHAFSFRFDTLCLFFSLLALYLYPFHRGRASAAGAGAALAISFLVSVKTVFMLLPLLAIAALQHTPRETRRTEFKRTALFLLTLAGVFTLLYALRASLTSGTTPTTGETETMLDFLARAGSRMFLEEGLLPRAEYLWRGFRENAGHWSLLGAGVIVALYQLATRTQGSRQHLILLCFLLPLLSVFFYRNAFPYFYVMVIPPAMLVAGLAIETALRHSPRLGSRGPALVVAAVLAIGLSGTSMYLLLEHREGISQQRLVLQAVHEIFPEPVPYIDGYGMVSSFPKVGLWMSTWAMEEYHRQGQPVMESIVREHQPHFILVNHPALPSRESRILPDNPFMASLLPPDTHILATHFIPHWGPIYIAGREFEIDNPGITISFEVLISGEYTLEAAAPAWIDDNLLLPGETIQLGQHSHLLKPGTNKTIRLRRGDNPYRPARPAPEARLFKPL